MKKVININFQGRVIPIEETAYESLKQYIDSLRRHFANEEGREEIINDIENRIAELFSEELKKGQPCITDSHVESIMRSIGRPEDLDQPELNERNGASGSGQTMGGNPHGSPRGSVYRNANDKILGGVCSGIAHYLRLDPTIVRVIFALITLGGFGSGFLIYLVLWIVLPVQSMRTEVRRRLFRNPDGKVIGGVANGIATYFNIAVWIPRLIFTLPFLITALSDIWMWDGFMIDIFMGGFSSTLFLLYIILWIVIPQARTASEKLEMRGEKVDLESIRNSIQSELQDVKSRAGELGTEFQSKVKTWSEEVKNMGQDVRSTGQSMAGEAVPVARRTGSAILEVILVLIKAFFLFIAGIIVFVLFVTLLALLFSGTVLFGMKDFVLNGFWENLLAFNTLALFIGMPIVAMVVWIIRRIAGVRSRSNMLGWVFGGLWTIGIASVTILAVMITRDYKTQESVESELPLVMPTSSKMDLQVVPPAGKFHGEWFINDGDDELLSENGDSLLLKTIRVVVLQSPDSAYHVKISKRARAANTKQAEAVANQISYPLAQQDSILQIPDGFPISKSSGFRNQQVVLYLDVPVGKQVRIAEGVDDFSWFNLKMKKEYRDRGFIFETEVDDEGYPYKYGTWYTMTETGLVRTDRKPEEEKEEGRYRYKETSAMIPTFSLLRLGK